MRPRLPCCPGLQHARQRDIMDVQTSLSGHSCSWSGILADCCGTWHQECGCSCPGEFGCSGLACVPRGVQSPPPHGLGCRPQCGRASPPFAVERLHVVVRPRQDRGAAPWSMLSSHTRPEDQAFGIQHAMPDILTACHPHACLADGDGPSAAGAIRVPAVIRYCRDWSGRRAGQ